MLTSFKPLLLLLLFLAGYFGTGTAYAGVPVGQHLAKAPAAIATHMPTSATTARTKKHVHHNHAIGHRYKAFLIPPPPAFMPSILPELMSGRAAHPAKDTADLEEADKPENPYKKYINTPGGEAPEPVQVRKGVVTWTQHS